MKTVVAVTLTVLVLVPTAFATSRALDPRVPAIKRQITALRAQVSALQGSKLDKSCVALVPLVVRPGYLYAASDGSVIVYKAMDEFDSSIDKSGFTSFMVLAKGC